MDGTEDLDQLKKKKDIEKLQLEIDSAARSLKLQWLQAWASLLGPIMAAATILGTVYIGYLQISSKARADEDQNWRETIQAINSSSSDIQARNYVTLLAPFLESKRYRTLAIGVTVAAMPKIRDPGTFDQLLRQVFPSVGGKDLPTIFGINQGLQKAVPNVSQIPSDLQGSAWEDAWRKKWASDETHVVLDELTRLCIPIADILRHADHRSLANQFTEARGATSSVILPTAYLEGCDLGGIDFSDIDLRNVTFDRVVLDESILRNNNGEDKYLWSTTIWWTAKEIEPKMLSALLKNFKPYQFYPGSGNWYRNGVSISKADWETNIRRLCAQAGLKCTEDQIKADFPMSASGM